MYQSKRNISSASNLVRYPNQRKVPPYEWPVNGFHRWLVPDLRPEPLPGYPRQFQRHRRVQSSLVYQSNTNDMPQNPAAYRQKDAEYSGSQRKFTIRGNKWHTCHIISVKFPISGLKRQLPQKASLTAKLNRKHGTFQTKALEQTKFQQVSKTDNDSQAIRNLKLRNERSVNQ